jgi:hypothetical protein
MNRRELTGGGGVLAVLAALPVEAKTAAGARAPLTVVLRDDRYADSRLYADHFAARGAIAVSTSRDVARVWRTLQTQRGAGPLRLTGLTPYSDFVVLRGEALAAGARLRFFGEHDARGSSGLVHRFRGAGAIETPGADWAATVAALADRHTDREPPLTGAWTATSTARPPDYPGTLYSWLIG